MSLTQDIKHTIELLKKTDINGCITGSSMLDCDFDLWDSAPDIDVFVYTKPQLQYAANLLMMKYDFEPLSDGEEWKLERIQNKDSHDNSYLSTIKLKRGEVVVNITYKKYKNNIFAVLSSFDMTIIMIGFDIRKKVLLDLRCGWDDMVREDPEDRWSHSTNIAKPNPLRDQDVDMYGVEMWVRQWDRVIKYWNRSFDTREMAKFYIKLINGVIDKGRLFNTNKSDAAYQAFITTYEPLRDKMVQWLTSKEGI